MSFYHDFTANRTTVPDFPELCRQLRLLDPTAGPTALGDFQYRIKKETDWLPAHITAAQNVIDTSPVYTEGKRAQQIIDNMPVFEKSLYLALLDQLNFIRARLPVPLGPITPAQAIQAARDKAGTL